MFRKYLFVILYLLFCFDVYAGTIHSYTLKSPPDNADEIPIYDSSDGSTKKIEVGDISGSGSGINWNDLQAISSLSNANQFIVNVSGTSRDINWQDLKSNISSGINWMTGDLLKSQFNIVNYGAVGDGTTDNTTSIQNAFDAAHTNGGIVYIPAGTFLTGKITTYKNVSIRGVNKSASVLKAKSATTDVIYYLDDTTSDPNTNSTYLLATYDNFQVNCNSTGSNGINIGRAPLGHIDNIGVYNCAIGVKWSGNWTSVISNSNFRFNTTGFSAGEIQLSGGGARHDPNLITIVNTVFRENTSWGIIWDSGSSLVCRTCDIERNGTSGDSTTGGIKVTNVDGPAAGRIGLVFIDGWFESNWGDSDIYITTPYQTGVSLVLKNTMFYAGVPSGTSVTYNIDAPDSSHVLQLSNNYFYTAPTGAGHINTAGNVYEDNNTFTTTPLTGGGKLRSALYNKFDADQNGTGNIGIGTVAPGALFSVVNSNTTFYSVNGAASGARVNITNSDSSATNNYAELRFMNENTSGAQVTGAQIAGVNSVHTAGSESTDVEINTRNAGTLRNSLHIDHTGAIGIGTINVSRGMLNIQQATDSSSGGISTAGASGVGTLRFWSDAGGGGHIDTNSGGTGLLTLNIGGGNVGVGTSNATALLTVGTASPNQFKVSSTGGITVLGNVGVSTVAPTTCGCKTYTNGICTTLGTCS
mgnify:CR=1 FL=1